MTANPGTGSPKKSGLMRRVFFQVREQWHSLFVVFLLEVLSTPLALLAPLGIKIAVDNVVAGRPLSHFLRAVVPAGIQSSSGRLLTFAILVQIGVAALIQAHWYGTYLLKIRTGEHMLLNFRSLLFRHAQRLPLGYHNSRGSSDTAFRLQDDAAALKSITIDGAIFLLSDLAKLAAMACVTFLIDWRLGLVALSVAPLLCLHAFVYEKRVGGKYTEVRNLESAAFRVIHESLSTIRVVKAFVQEDAEQRRFVDQSRRAGQARLRLAHADGLFGMAINLTTAAGMATVLYVGIRNVTAGTLTLGSLLVVITYLVQLYAPLQNITYHLASLKASAASVERAMHILEQKPEETHSTPSILPIPRRVVGHIEFQNVTFAYGDKLPILKNFSAKIPAGSRVAIIGRTGAGKTTIVNLLARFIIPQSGRILLDGEDIQRMDLSSLRKQLAFVLQDPALFSTSIAENVAYGDPHASRSRVVRAAREARAHRFIEHLPGGYQTDVGERGSLLSGGERQRISMARAFLIDAPILILDEPTSSVDIATEHDIMHALDALTAGRTCLLISHRLDTLSSCDLVFRMRHSGVVEVSTQAKAGLTSYFEEMRRHSAG